MKKLLFFFSVIILSSCSSATTEVENDVDTISPEDRVVKFEFNTTELTLDEIRISYFDYVTNTYPVVVHNFTYDSSGEPIPFVMTFENYNYRYISGEAYRNNPNTEEISVKIYVNDEIVVEEVGKGEDGEYAEIRFNYDIDLMKDI